MTSFRAAYYAGWRAGMCSAPSDCPLRGIRRQLWLQGWEAGMREQLGRWVMSRLAG